MASASYPGNPSLSAEVKNRVVSTFRQAVDLFKKGRTAEVVSGCDYILKMDPMFAPAKKLLEKAKNPAAAVDVDTLMGSLGETSASLDEARAAFAARDYDRAARLSEEVLGNDLTNTEAQQLAQQAREKLEAQPFVEQFLEKARQQIASGNPSAAQTAIEKAKALDATHPRLREVEASLGSASRPTTFDFGAESSPFGDSFPAAEAATQAPTPSFDFDQPAASPTSTPSFSLDQVEATSPPAASPPGAVESSPSFVVEPPAGPAARSSSEASDFGFTFEEEQKAAEASSAQPAAGGPSTIAGEAGTFDFSTASVEVSAEEQSKISKYLQEGDQAFDSGDFQKAIDLWSRIFLIDVTNEEASVRIEKARARRLETDRKVEELIAVGARSLERGDREGAKAKFEEALKLDPTNSSASEYLEQIASGAVPAAAAPAAAPGRAPGGPAKPPGEDLFAEEFGAPSAQSSESLVPPTPSASRARAAAVAVEEKKERPKMMMVGIIAAAILVLAAGGWLVFSKLGGGGGGFDARSTAAAFAEAQTLAGQGQIDRAIALLSAIKPEDPQYERALALIADLQKKKSQGSGLTQSRPSLETFNENLQKGRTAFAANDFMTAKQAFEQAASIQPLPPEVKQLYDTASQQVARLQTASNLFKEGNYREAIRSLEALLEQEPANQNARQMIANAYFNLGQIALQEEKTQEAITQFDKVLATNPLDETAKRSRDLAARYNGERKDLLYKIYVKYLPLRNIS